MTSYRITVSLFGGISTGKTTLMNALFSKKYSDMKIKRTTMVPQIYYETTTETYSDNILGRNRDNNISMDNKSITTEGLLYGDIKELEYYVPKIEDFLNLPNILLSVYDLPGINDSQTKNIYVEYINDNFYKFDIIIWLIDINSALNTSDEMDILNLIMTGINNNKEKYGIITKLLILVNKCDDMKIENDNFIFSSNDIEEMYKQITTIIKCNLVNIEYEICPISCESAYIYRSYKNHPDIDLDTKYMDKFGFNEYGKALWNKMTFEEKKSSICDFVISSDYQERMMTTGFMNFKTVLHEFLKEPHVLTSNAIKYEIVNLSLELNDLIDEQITDLTKCWEKIIVINNIFGCDDNLLKPMYLDKLQQCYISFNSEADKIFSEIVVSEGIDNSLLLTRIENIWSRLTDTIIDTKTLCVTKRLTITCLYIYEHIYNKILQLLQIINIATNSRIYVSANKIYNEIVKNIYTNTISIMTDTLSLKLKLQYIDTLIKFKCEKWKKYLQKALLTSDFMELSNENKIMELESLNNKYGLTADEFITMMFNILDEIYSRDFEECISHLHGSRTYFFKLQIWNNLTIKTSNKYYNYIMSLKYIFSKIQLSDININSNSNSNSHDLLTEIIDTDATMLENFVISIIKKHNPCDLYSSDEIIDFISNSKYQNRPWNRQ